MTSTTDSTGMGFREAAAPYLFDAVPEPLVVLTSDGVMTVVNASAERMFGRPAHRLVGRPCRPFFDPAVGIRPVRRPPSTLRLQPRAIPVHLRSSGTSPDVRSMSRCGVLRSTTAAGPGTVVSIHDMTAERERKESSRAGSERLLRIAEAIRVGVGLIRTDPPEYVYTNPTFREMIGSPGMVGTNGMVGTHPAGTPAVIDGHEAMRRALDTIGSGQPFSTTEVRMAGLGGDARWVRMTTGQVGVTNGVTTEVAVTLEDITAFKDVETTLQDSQRVMLEMADTIEIGFLLRQVSDQRIVYISPGFLRIFGFDPTGPTRDFLELRQMIHPDDRETLADAIRLVETGGRAQRDLRITHPDGGQRWVRFTANPIVDADGVVSRLAVAAEEFTAVREAEMVVRLSEDRFRRAANAIDVGISLRQLEPHRFLYVNSRYIDIIGYDPTVADDATAVDAVARLHPDDRDGVLVDYWKRTMSGMSAQAEMRVVLESGGTRWIRATSHPIPAEPGSPAMAAGTIEDITDRKAAEQAVHSARQEAELAVLARTEYLSRISHELRTPLNAVLGFEHLLDGGVAPGPASDAVGHILRGGRNLLNMINDLLDDSRIGDSLELSVDVVDIGRIAARDHRIGDTGRTRRWCRDHRRLPGIRDRVAGDGRPARVASGPSRPAVQCSAVQPAGRAGRGCLRCSGTGGDGVDHRQRNRYPCGGHPTVVRRVRPSARFGIRHGWNRDGAGLGAAVGVRDGRPAGRHLHSRAGQCLHRPHADGALGFCRRRRGHRGYASEAPLHPGQPVQRRPGPSNPAQTPCLVLPPRYRRCTGARTGSDARSTGDHDGHPDPGHERR